MTITTATSAVIEAAALADGERCIRNRTGDLAEAQR